MGDKYFKYVQWLLYLLMGLSALFVILFYISPSNPDMLLYWMYALLIFSGVVIFSVSAYAMMKNPKGSYKALLAIAGLIILALLTYLMSKNTYSPAMLEKYSISANGVKWVGAGLFTTYIILFIAVGTLIYSSVSKFFK
jgi:NADH:ubiquinone oxidoreductase subunit 6 (subunit J)